MYNNYSLRLGLLQCKSLQLQIQSTEPTSSCHTG